MIEYRRAFVVVVVSIGPDTWLIWDRLRGKSDHKVEFLLHLRPDCSVRSTSDSTRMILGSPGGTLLQVLMLGPQGEVTLPEVLVGNDVERAAWYSPGYGTRVQTRVLSLQRESVRQCESFTCLSTSTEISPLLVDHGARLHMEFLHAARRKDTIFYCPTREYFCRPLVDQVCDFLTDRFPGPEESPKSGAN